jgi:hypothetical protein
LSLCVFFVRRFRYMRRDNPIVRQLASPAAAVDVSSCYGSLARPGGIPESSPDLGYPTGSAQPPVSESRNDRSFAKQRTRQTESNNLYEIGPLRSRVP